MLAETVSIDGGTLLLILVVGLLFLAMAVAIVVFGFVLAPRAARGESRALGWWVGIVALEGLYCLGSLAAVLSGDFTLGVLVPLVIVAAQVAIFLRARRDADR